MVILDTLARPGVEANLEWLRQRHGGRVHPIRADIREAGVVARAVEGADAIFHLAAQVAVTTSLEAPVPDFEINLGGTLNLLEAARRASTPLIFASTNKVYGDLADVGMELEDGRWLPADAPLAARGISEARPLSFHTPYGCSKGAADQYVLDYARSFGLPAAVLRMSCIYGPRQMGTEDQGWVAHFLIRALEGRPISLFGDGRQVRDILFVDDAVEAYVQAWKRIDAIRGRAFNLGGGPDNAVSLRQLLAEIEALTGCPVAIESHAWRPGDQRWFVADIAAAREALGLGRPLPWRHGLARLARWLQERAAAPRPQEVAA